MVLLTLIAISGAMCRPEPARHITFELTCGRCGYDRTGLPRDGLCPECGSAVVPPKPVSVRVQPPPHSGPVIVFSWAMLAAYYLLGEWLARGLVTCSYRVMGYSWATSRLAMAHREFLDADRPIELDAFLWPLGIAIAFSPLLQRLPPGRKRRLRMAQWAALGLLATAAIWTLPYVRW